MTNHESAHRDDTTESVEEVEDLIDEWGEDSFPASDPPGSLPPSLDRVDSSEGSCVEPRARGGTEQHDMTTSRHDDRANLIDIYLDDHWAGAAAGAALASRLARENANSVWGADLALVADQIRGDRRALADVRRHLHSEGGTLKKAVALIGERLSRLKLNGRFTRYSPLSRVLELEALISGVSAKQRLWVTLQAFDQDDGRLVDFDLGGLEAEASSQVTLLSAIHDAAVEEVFG
jgi:hypothetical protein